MQKSILNGIKINMKRGTKQKLFSRKKNKQTRKRPYHLKAGKGFLNQCANHGTCKSNIKIRNFSSSKRHQSINTYFKLEEQLSVTSNGGKRHKQAFQRTGILE